MAAENTELLLELSAAEHAKEAERLLVLSLQFGEVHEHAACLARALVHATLAVAKRPG